MEPFRAAAIASVPLSPPTRKNSILGEPFESFTELWSRDDAKVQVGIWECTPGSFLTERSGTDEIVYIVSGRGRLVSDDGVETEHAAGDVLVIPDGFKGVWHIHETIRKVYVGSSS